MVGKCPRCGGEVAELQKGFFCQNDSCKFAIWKNNKWWAAKKKQPTKAVAVSYTHLDVYKRQENIFENSDFVYMLNQAGGDRQILAKQLGISTHQLSYVTHSGEGEGLLFYGSTILPFVDLSLIHI